MACRRFLGYGVSVDFTEASPAIMSRKVDYVRRLDAALVEHRMTGASFAYWDGATLHTATAGLRNSVTRDPVTADTVMHIGSITKVLNTVLLMQLVDDGA